MPIEGWSISRIEKAGMEIRVFKVAPRPVNRCEGGERTDGLCRYGASIRSLKIERYRS
jgi:hypothetical protein